MTNQYADIAYVETSKEETYRLALESIIRWTDNWAVNLSDVVYAVSLVAKTALED